MDIRALQYFVAVVESTSITKAAKVLHISQPPLSQQIKQLEIELGTQLLVRGPRCITLTSAGETLYRRAKSIISFTEDTCREIQSISNGNSGHISIGIISSFDPKLFSDILSEFYSEYPNIQFGIYERNTYDLLDSLENNLIELAFVRTPFLNESYEKILLSEDPMSAVGKKAYFDGIHSDSLNLNFFHNKPIIVYRRWKHILEVNFKQQNVEPIYYCINDDAKTSLQLALTGNGIAIVPASISGTVTNNHTMQTLPIHAPQLLTKTYVIWKPNRYMTPAATNFVDHIKQLNQAQKSNQIE